MQKNHNVQNDIVHKTKVFLGEEVGEQFECFPVLVFCQYQMGGQKSLQQQKDGLFSGNSMVLKNTFKKRMERLLVFFTRIIPYVCMRAYYNKTNTSEIDAIIDASFLDSSRYKDVRKKVISGYSIARIVSFDDTPTCLYTAKNEKFWDFLFKPELLGVKTFFWGKDSITGVNLKKATNNWHKFACEMDNKGQNLSNDYDRGIEILKKLNKAYIQRRQWLIKKLEKCNVKNYITSNQYNLNNLLLINASQVLGIRTKQLEHHTCVYDGLQIANGKIFGRLFFAQESCCWTQNDIDFCKKNIEYLNVLSEKNVMLKLTGNPEISYQKALELQRKIHKTRTVLYLVSGIMGLDTMQKKEIAFKWIENVYKQLAILAKKEKANIIIRYGPRKEYIFKDEELAMIEKYKFIQSEDTVESLLPDILKSMVTISAATTALATAELFGLHIYQINNYSGAEYGGADLDYNEISKIKLPDIVEECVLNKKDFLEFNLETLFS